MKYWFGYRVVEFDGSNPGRKCLSEDYETYDLAKKSKDCLRAGDIEFTPIFSAKSAWVKS